VDEPELPGPFEVALCPEHLRDWERHLEALAEREEEPPMGDASWRALRLGAEALRELGRERDDAGELARQVVEEIELEAEIEAGR
jgi:hypothetical protein